MLFLVLVASLEKEFIDCKLDTFDRKLMLIEIEKARRNLWSKRN